MNSKRQQNGFSLIEVMIAILILGVALTGLVHGITTALASNKDSELQTVAAWFAQGKIEELRASDTLSNGEDEGDCGAVLPQYHWRETVIDADVPGLHDVSVVVEHGANRQEIYELKTLLFEPEDDSTKAKDKHRKKGKGQGSGES